MSDEMDIEAGKMATQFAKYADLTVAFAVAQSLTFLYKAADPSELRTMILRGYSLEMWLIFMAGVVYVSLTLYCGRRELALRMAARHSSEVLSAARAARIGRAIIVLAFTAVANGGLWLICNPQNSS